MEEIGPVDYAIVGFPGNEFRGEIGPALAELVESDTIRIIDIAFAGKDSTATWPRSSSPSSIRTCRRASRAQGSRCGLLSEDDIRDAADGLDPDTSIALIVWENVWARR